MSTIDPVQFGQLIATMQHLATKLEETSKSNEALTARVAELESRWDTGKKGLAAVVLVVGFALFGVKETFQTLLKLVMP
jgi:hypothetical protein